MDYSEDLLPAALDDLHSKQTRQDKQNIWGKLLRLSNICPSFLPLQLDLCFCH
jgi:hypothetical protein